MESSGGFSPTPGCSGEGNKAGSIKKNLLVPSSPLSHASTGNATPKRSLPITSSSRRATHPKADTAAPQLQPVACGPDENAIKPILDRARLSLLITDSERTSTRDVMSEVSSDANCLVRVPFFFSNLCFLFEITIFLN